MIAWGIVWDWAASAPESIDRQDADDGDGADSVGTLRSVTGAVRMRTGILSRAIRSKQTCIPNRPRYYGS